MKESLCLWRVSYTAECTWNHESSKGTITLADKKNSKPNILMIVERILVTKQLYPPGGIFVLYSLFILKSVPYQIITKEHFFFNFLFLGSNVFLEYPGSFFHEKKYFKKKYQIDHSDYKFGEIFFIF